MIEKCQKILKLTIHLLKMVVEMSKNTKIDTNCIEFEYTINII